MHVQWQFPVFITSYMGCHHPPTAAGWQPVPSMASLTPEAGFWHLRAEKEAAGTKCHPFCYLRPSISLYKLHLPFVITTALQSTITISRKGQSSWANLSWGKRNMLRVAWVSPIKLGKSRPLYRQHWHRKAEQAGVQPLVLLPSAENSELCYSLPPKSKESRNPTENTTSGILLLE